MQSDQTVRQSDQVAFRELTGGRGSVLLHLETGAYHELNAVGTLIWKLTGSGSNVTDIVGGVRAAVTDAPAHLADEVHAFISDLIDRDLLVQVDR